MVVGPTGHARLDALIAVGARTRPVIRGRPHLVVEDVLGRGRRHACAGWRPSIAVQVAVTGAGTSASRAARRRGASRGRRSEAALPPGARVGDVGRIHHLLPGVRVRHATEHGALVANVLRDVVVRGGVGEGAAASARRASARNV